MHSRSKLSPRFALLALVAALGGSAHAIVATTGSTTPIDTTYSFVGYVDSFGGSAVAVGPHTFLTAGHVVVGGTTSQTITMGGTTYSIASSLGAPDILVTDPSSSNYGQMTHVDLTLVTVNGTLPGFYSIGTGMSLSNTTSVTMVGYGNTGGVAADGLSYNVPGKDGNRHAGNNTLDAAGDIYVAPGTTGLPGTGGGPVIESYLKGAGGAAVGAQDSGGGWFVGTTLVGISDFFFNTSTSLGNYGFPSANGGTPYFGSGAINLTDSRLRSFLSGANPVPEPGTWAALGLGTLAFLRRKRR